MKRGSLKTILSRPSEFSNETGELPNGEFEPIVDYHNESANPLLSSRILVVGAGGLGCEILKDLAMSGFKDVHIIDLDSIDVTNLNRQFLFREKDVGHSKAKVAAEFITTRCPWIKVTPHHGKIESKDESFYKSFSCIISGLDNVEARRWLNSFICKLVQKDEDGDIDPETIIPIIDGGTEGFKGQARVILPLITSCFECTLDMFPKQETYPLCTIAQTPRKPEHCIAYASMIQWDKEFPDKKLDGDSPTDMKWVYEKALERSKEFGIPGVTYMLTMGVVKSIIPAVASTNAIIAAACVNEAIKILTFCSQTLNTYFMYLGGNSISSHTFEAEKKDDCLVCSQKSIVKTVKMTMTLGEFLEEIKQELNLANPSVIEESGNTLYMPRPPALERSTRPNLEKSFQELQLYSGTKLNMTDANLPDSGLNITVKC